MSAVLRVARSSSSRGCLGCLGCFRVPGANQRKVGGNLDAFPPSQAAMSTAAQRGLNKKLSQIFRMRGLSVRPDAMQPLYDCLENDENWEATLQALLGVCELLPKQGTAVLGLLLLKR